MSNEVKRFALTKDCWVETREIWYYASRNGSRPAFAIQNGKVFADKIFCEGVEKEFSFGEVDKEDSMILVFDNKKAVLVAGNKECVERHIPWVRVNMNNNNTINLGQKGNPSAADIIRGFLENGD